MTRFEQLVAEVSDAMMGTAGNNTYVFSANEVIQNYGLLEQRGRLVFCSEQACYAWFITGTGNRPEGFHKWMEERR